MYRDKLDRVRTALDCMSINWVVSLYQVKSCIKIFSHWTMLVCYCVVKFRLRKFKYQTCRLPLSAFTQFNALPTCITKSHVNPFEITASAAFYLHFINITLLDILKYNAWYASLDCMRITPSPLFVINTVSEFKWRPKLSTWFWHANGIAPYIIYAPYKHPRTWSIIVWGPSRTVT